MGPWALPQQMSASPAPFSPRARPLLAALASGSALLALALLGPAPSGAAAKPVELEPALKTLLASGNLRDFDGACATAVEQGDGPRLRLLQQRLLGLHPAPQPLAVMFANAEVLLRCEAPDGALQVLARISPAAGAERIQWLVMQWRAAQAGLNHQVAANALRRLAAGNLAQLEALELPVSRRQDGTAVTRSALDLLAGHLESLGQRQRAAEVLLSGTQPGAVNAARLAQAVALFDGLPAVEQDRLLELALEQAATAGAWGLVGQILDQQLALGQGIPERTERAAERRLRLSRGIDDAYAEWLLGRTAQSRQAELERQLRSPRSPGGHAPKSFSDSQP